MGGKGLWIAKSSLNGDLNPNVSVGLANLLLPKAGSVPKGPKPALARPSSWPLAKSSLQWRFKP